MFYPVDHVAFFYSLQSVGYDDQSLFAVKSVYGIHNGCLCFVVKG